MLWRVCGCQRTAWRSQFWSSTMLSLGVELRSTFSHSHHLHPACLKKGKKIVLFCFSQSGFLHVAQAGLELRDQLASASPLFWLQACTTTTGFERFFLIFIFSRQTFFFFETGFLYVALAVLELDLYNTLASNSQRSVCFYLLSALPLPGRTWVLIVCTRVWVC